MDEMRKGLVVMKMEGSINQGKLESSIALIHDMIRHREMLTDSRMTGQRYDHCRGDRCYQTCCATYLSSLYAIRVYPGEAPSTSAFHQHRQGFTKVAPQSTNGPSAEYTKQALQPPERFKKNQIGEIKSQDAAKLN